MNDVSAEIAIFAVTQIGVTIWLLSAMRRDITNLTGWVAKIDARSLETSNLAAELKGRVEDSLMRR